MAAAVLALREQCCLTPPPSSLAAAPTRSRLPCPPPAAPACQVANFKWVPVQFQLLVVNLFTILGALSSWAGRGQDGRAGPVAAAGMHAKAAGTRPCGFRLA